MASASVVSEGGVQVYPCTKCGAATKEHHDGARICSRRVCRAVFAAKDLKSIVVAEAAAPMAPCPKCGKETKEHHDGGRICSSRVCPTRVARLAS